MQCKIQTTTVFSKWTSFSE